MTDQLAERLADAYRRWIDGGFRQNLGEYLAADVRAWLDKGPLRVPEPGMTVWWLPDPQSPNHEMLADIATLRAVRKLAGLDAADEVKP